MKLCVSGLVGASLLLKAAAEDLASSEQFCLAKAGSPLFNNDPVPTVTIIYSGTTVTTTIAAFTSCEEGRRTLPAESDSGSLLASTTGSHSAVDGQTSAGSGESLRGSQTASTVPLASALSSQQSLSVPNTASASADLPTQVTTPTNGNRVAAPSPTTGSGSGANTSSAPRGASHVSEAPVSSPHSAITTGSNALGGESDASKSAASSQTASGSGSAHLNSSTWSMATPSGADSLRNAGSTQVFATPSAMPPTNPPIPGETAGSRNSTLTLSRAAVDALQLAQFLKNLGVSVFNSSYQLAGPMASNSRNSTSLAESIADISLVSTDLRTL
jgi:hypothetical protein